MGKARGAPPRHPSLGCLLDAPLPELLAELRVVLVDSAIVDANFLGAYVEHHDGARVLTMPAGRSALERDTVARMLLAEGLGLDAPPLPVPLKATPA